MKRFLDGAILALSIFGLAYFLAPDVRAWLEGTHPVEVACSR